MILLRDPGRADESSALTAVRLPNPPHCRLLLFLVWSARSNGGTLPEWARSEDGQRVYRKLIQDFCTPKSPAEVALILTALVSLTRLCADGIGVPASSVEESHVLSSLSLLGDFPTGNRQATLEHLVWSLWAAASPQVAVTESLEILRILTHAVDEPERMAEFTDNDIAPYWKRRFSPLRSHQEALSSMSDLG